ncbi:MAG TPA: 2-C-methyl-D-erythritol 2,4-cyclodiphosphate synthase [Firmicutes bacterium]|nr:2-C-methyl-D-erythritol 2,4-cyclodiphosphate synthase [Bacillota bacterium]
MEKRTDWQVVAIIPAAGSGRRMRTPGQPKTQKLLLPLAGKTILRRTLEALSLPEITAFFLPVAPEDQPFFAEELKAAGLGQEVIFCAGGPERQDSIANALAAVESWSGWRVPPEQRLVVIHDAARPLVETETIRLALAVAQETWAACVGVPVKDTIKVVGPDGVITQTPDRRTLWAAQTPQVFSWPLLRQAYAQAQAGGEKMTDDAALVERTGHPVRIVPGSYRNLKITTPEDIPAAAALLNAVEAGQATGEITGEEAPVLTAETAASGSRPAPTVPALRVGQGFDVHRLVTGRRLVLGGVEIPAPVGLAGHSDADVLIHAVMDALLGAAGAGDIGELFPDTDPAYCGIDSTLLLREVMAKLKAAGWKPVNLDVTVIAQKPKLAPYRGKIRARLATLLGLPETAVNVKATTTEGLGFTGREEGIAAQAVVLLESISFSSPASCPEA